MDPVLIVVLVVAFVQGIKELLAKWKVTVQSWIVLLITILVCIGETAEATLNAGKELIAFGTLWLLLKVVVGALGTYGLVKKVSPTPVPTPPVS